MPQPTKSEKNMKTEENKICAIDWSYDFRQHFNNLCASDHRRDEECDLQVTRLKAIADAHSEGKQSPSFLKSGSLGRVSLSTKAPQP